jgi:hypothetical protein
MVPSLLPPIKYEPILYDLRDLSWCIWLGAFFGAPVIVFIRGKKSDADRIKKLEGAFEAKQKEADHKRYLQWKDQDRKIHQLKCELEEATKESMPSKNSLFFCRQLPEEKGIAATVREVDPRVARPPVVAYSDPSFVK